MAAVVHLRMPHSRDGLPVGARFVPSLVMRNENVQRWWRRSHRSTRWVSFHGRQVAAGTFAADTLAQTRQIERGSLRGHRPIRRWRLDRRLPDVRRLPAIEHRATPSQQQQQRDAQADSNPAQPEHGRQRRTAVKRSSALARSVERSSNRTRRGRRGEIIVLWFAGSTGSERDQRGVVRAMRISANTASLVRVRLNAIGRAGHRTGSMAVSAGVEARGIEGPSAAHHNACVICALATISVSSLARSSIVPTTSPP